MSETDSAGSDANDKQSASEGAAPKSISYLHPRRERPQSSRSSSQAGASRSGTPAPPPVSSRRVEPAVVSGTPRTTSSTSAASAPPGRDGKPEARPAVTEPAEQVPSAPTPEVEIMDNRRPSRTDGQPDTALDPWDFDEDVDVFAATEGSPVAVETDEGILIRWEAAPNVSGQVVYVVAASDEGPVQVLHRAERLAATTQRSVVVSKSAGPYFGIFTFVGADVESAKRATGAPHGAVRLLREVREVISEAFASVVIMRWRKPDDVASVVVMRSRPNEDLPDTFQPRYLVPCTPNMLQDESVEPGARYTYRIYSVSDRGQRSVGVIRSVIVPEQPIAVTDLQAEAVAIREGDPWVNLTYSEPPSGRVTIFESSVRPRPVSDDQLFEANELERLGLGSAITAHPIHIEDGRMLLSGVMYSTSQGLSRYYTPVTAGDDRYRVGRTAVVHYVGPPRDAEILDRVSWQLLRFRWPQGAASAVYHISPPGAKVAPDDRQEVAVSRAIYDRDGGVKLDLLPDRGATLFIRGKFFDGRDHFGAWAVIPYYGRVKLAYRLAPGEGNTVSLEVWSERPLNRLQAIIKSHPTRWLRNVSHNPAGTTAVERVDWPRPVQPGVWVSIREGLVLPPGQCRAFFYIPELPAGESLMVLDPLPMPLRNRRPGIAEAAGAVRNLVDRALTRGNQQVDIGPTYAECPVCFEKYAEDQAWLRCSAKGECAAEPDSARARLTRENPVPMGRPVHPVSVAQTVRGHTPCPACGNPDTVTVCPHCHAELPPNWNSDRTALYFTFVGSTSSGKTTFLGVLLEQLRTVVQPALGRMFLPLNYSTQRRVAEYRARLFEEGKTEAGTKPVSENLELLEPLVFDAGPNLNGQPASIVLYDVSGEDMKTAADTARYAHVLDNSSCLIFLVDLLQIDAVREQVRGLSDGLAELPVKVTDPTQVLINVANAIRQRRGQFGGQVDVRAAIALAKFDVFQLGMRNRNGDLARLISPGSVLMQDPYAAPGAPTGPGGLFFPADSQQVHLEARDLLEQLDAREFLNTLDLNFTNFRFFSVSALGHAPLNGQKIADSGISAFRLADMVRWTMTEHWYS